MLETPTSFNAGNALPPVAPRSPAGPGAPGVDALDRAILEAIAHGLPLLSRPYESIGHRVGLSEAEVIRRLGRLIERGTVRRLGVVVRHRPLGYRANAMAVWDVPDGAVDALGACVAGETAVNLCYRRPRRPPVWPYNLFCMVHGKDRGAVLATIEDLARRHGLDRWPGAVLFSTRCFKQRGAVHFQPSSRPVPASPEHDHPV